MTGARILAPAAALLIAAMPAPAAPAGPAGNHEAEVARCIRQSAHGRKWLEMTLWGLRDQEGGWSGAEVRNSNGTSDLGPLQINSWWIPLLAVRTGAPEASVRRWLVSDICFNVDVGRWIFLTGLSVTGDYWSAVGAYHSPTPTRARRYALLVSQKLRRRFGRQVFGRSTGPPPGRATASGRASS